MPISRATRVISFPLVWASRTASRLNSEFVYLLQFHRDLPPSQLNHSSYPLH